MSRFLVEVTPGRELLYRSPSALREAMRSGEITADSRVFHRASSRWISITEHPEYRKFLTERHPPVLLEPATPEDGKRVTAAPGVPISHKAAEIYQRVATGLTELKRRLEATKPKPSSAPTTAATVTSKSAPPVSSKPASPRPPKSRAKAAAPPRSAAPAPSNSEPPVPSSSAAPAKSPQAEEPATPAPEFHPPPPSGTRDHWTFYP